MAERLGTQSIHGGDIDLILRQAYDAIWGVNDNAALWKREDGSSMSIPTVGYKEQEDLYGDGNPYFRKLDIYSKAEIKKHLGLSITEFMDLPPYRQRLMIRHCEKEIRRTSKEADEVMKKFKDLSEGDDE